MKIATYIFFGVGMCVMLLCMFGFFMMLRRPDVVARMAAANYQTLSEAQTAVASPVSPIQPIAKQDAEDLEEGSVVTEERNRPLKDKEPNDGGLPSWKEAKELLKKVWKNGLQIFFVFAVTLCLFPGLMAEIRPLTPGFPDDWFVIALLVCSIVFVAHPSFIECDRPHLCLRISLVSSGRGSNFFSLLHSYGFPRSVDLSTSLC